VKFAHGNPCSIPGQYVRDFRCTKWHLDWFFSEYFCSSLPPSVHQYSIFIIFVLLLPEGRTGEAWKGLKSDRCLYSQIADRWTELYFNLAQTFSYFPAPHNPKFNFPSRWLLRFRRLCLVLGSCDRAS